MYEETFEYKLWEPGKAWEEIAVFEKVTIEAVDFPTNSYKARRRAEILADEHRTEVRFNREGSPMGYYAGTDHKFVRIYGNR